VGAAFDLLVEAFEHVGALEMLMMLAGKPVEGQRLFDRFLDPSDEFGIAGGSFGDPCGEVLARLFDRTTVVKPAQFLQAVVGLAHDETDASVAEMSHRLFFSGCFAMEIHDDRADIPSDG
jgi:hypothetical protein